MSEVMLPMIEEGWKKPPVREREQSTSLMTPLGLIEGEVLTHVEVHGATALRRLIRELQWPATLVMMAVGALVRAGLVRAVQYDLEVILQPVTASPPAETRGTPEGGGGVTRRDRWTRDACG